MKNNLYEKMNGLAICKNNNEKPNNPIISVNIWILCSLKVSF